MLAGILFRPCDLNPISKQILNENDPPPLDLYYGVKAHVERCMLKTGRHSKHVLHPGQTTPPLHTTHPPPPTPAVTAVLMAVNLRATPVTE